MSARESLPATAREVFAAHPQMLSAEGAYIPERDDAPEPMTVEQIRAELTAEFVAWLVKRAREHRAQGPQYAKQADVIGRLASKVARGAVRPDNLRALPAQDGPEDVPALLAEVKQLRAELAARPSRADVLREVVSRLASRATLYGSSETVRQVMLDLGRLADTEQGGCTCDPRRGEPGPDEDCPRHGREATEGGDPR